MGAGAHPVPRREGRGDIIIHPRRKERARSGTGFRKRAVSARQVCPSRRTQERGIVGTGEGYSHRARETRSVSPGRDLQGKRNGSGKAPRGGHGPQLEPLTLGLYSHFRNLFIIAAPARAALRAALALRSAEPGPGCGTGRTRRQGRDWSEQADCERRAERRAAGGRCAGQVRGRKDAQRAARGRPNPADWQAGGRAGARKGAGTGRVMDCWLPAPPPVTAAHAPKAPLAPGPPRVEGGAGRVRPPIRDQRHAAPCSGRAAREGGFELQVPAPTADRACVALLGDGTKRRPGELRVPALAGEGSGPRRLERPHGGRWKPVEVRRPAG